MTFTTEKYSVYGSGLIGPGVICCRTQFADTPCFDHLGDTLNLIFADNDGTVFCPWVMRLPGYDTVNPDESGSWLNGRSAVQDRMNAWYLDGLIWPESGSGVYRGPAEEIFAHLYRASELAAREPERYRVKICNTVHSSAESVRGYFAIPAGAGNLQAALEVLNLIYSSEIAGEWADLMVYGVEGADYSIAEDGRYTQEGGEVSYRNAPLGCNGLFLGEWDTEPAGMRQLQIHALNNMHLSAYYGMTSDMTDLSELVRSLRTVAGEYIPLMTWGQIRGWTAGRYSSPAYENEELSKALTEAGIGEYLKWFQNLASEWLSN